MGQLVTGYSCPERGSHSSLEICWQLEKQKQSMLNPWGVRHCFFRLNLLSALLFGQGWVDKYGFQIEQ